MNTALQKAFIENLTEILISKADISNLIRVGDWNVTLEAVVASCVSGNLVFIEICLRSL